jgi:membrane fusion protein, heavy metal efflux system
MKPMMARPVPIVLCVTVVCLAGTSCSRKADPPAASTPAATVDNRVKEADLTRIRLTAESEKRLGIALADATEGNPRRSSRVGGEVTVIPGKVLTATAPVTGTLHALRASLVPGQTVNRREPLFRLTPVVGAVPDLKVTVEADVQHARARLDNATQQVERARRLLREMAGSQKSVDLAEQEFAQAKVSYDSAAERLRRLSTTPLDADVSMVITASQTGVVRQLQVSEGQIVSAGTLLFEVADLSRVWIRVPVYSGDIGAIDPKAAVQVRDVGRVDGDREAVRVAGPPTADPAAVTTDLYYEAANNDRLLHPGQRVTVVLPLRGADRAGVTVPASALLYDIQGGTWVYVSEAPLSYRRQRVELVEVAGGSAILSRGVARGTKVVTAGAAELFGTEFGAGK